jgi:hypothetical protein
MGNRNLLLLKILGWIESIAGGFGCLFSVWFISVYILYYFGGFLPNDGCGLGGLASLHLIWSLPLSILLVLGIGILKLYPWIRIAQIIIFSIISVAEVFILIFSILGYKQMLVPNLGFLWNLPGIAISSSIVWFLTRPAIKEQFK